MHILIEKEQTPKPVKAMGGKDKQGNEYGANSRYLTRNGKAILPVMGEFHFSRWMPVEWKEAILKMRAGGVDILATYVFWNHHEERKGEWDFTGCRDIRAFLDTCRELEMPVWLRIGPWAHGEARNGGFPDWLVKELGHNGLDYIEGASKEHETRTNDELYMKYVRNFWTKLASQVQGEMCKDGGPVIGVQLENEYCHAGGPVDKSRGIEHMKALKKLALELGFEVPYYTATGWGGAIVLEGVTLPVLGGYVDAPWAGHIHEMPACENFLMMPFRQDENIGADLAIDQGADCTFSKENNPYLTAELGGGLQVTALRRTYPYAEDIQTQALCMLGAGANLLGYYMYHGGVNPDGKDTTLQEARKTGYFNDLPAKSYDFQTCIRESGLLGESYHKLKMLHLMIHAFEQELAAAVAFFPEEQPQNAEDMTTPRISVRYNYETKGGFIFVNNHQRLRHMAPIKGMDVELEGIGEMPFTLSDISCGTDQCAVIPFGLQMGECRLLRTNASLLTRVGSRYFFYRNEEGVKPYFEYEDAAYDNVVVLDHREAQHAYAFGNRLYITECPLFMQDGALYLLAGEEEECIRIYEENGEPVDMYVLPPEIMTHVSANVKENSDTQLPEYAVQGILEQEKIHKVCKVYELQLNYDKVRGEYADEDSQDYLHEIYLTLDFGGNRAQLYQDGKLITDWFSNGEDWTVALKRYGYPQNLTMIVYPYEEDVYYDLPPRKGCELHHASAKAMYQLEV